MSKSLEALKEIKNSYSWTNPQREDKDNFEVIEKELKALEIIKNNIFEFIFIDITKRIILCFGETSWSYYCKNQEEYDLLKEVLL